MGILSGKVAIVTGAASGQGAAEASLFAAAGARVVVTDVSEGGRAVAAKLGDSAHFVRHDVSDQAGWDEVVKQTLQRFGGIDVLINNAGVHKGGSLLDTDLVLWDLHYRVNQLGVFLGMRSCMRLMANRGGGSIVNVSSMAGLAAHAGQFAYSTSKWAVRGMTKVAATDLGPLGIRVNSIHPGPIDTPMIQALGPDVLRAIASQVPLKRLGTSEEVAQLALFLASDLSSYITGAEVAIGGGFT